MPCRSAAALRQRRSRCLGSVAVACATLLGCGGSTTVEGEQARPHTTSGRNIEFLYRFTLSTVDKLDVLFVIDNSPSMADKQEILIAALPQLANSLIDPLCVEATTGAPTVDTSSLDGCDVGVPAFDPIENVHVGIVTTSLGTQGAVLCSPESESWQLVQNDHGRLISRALDGSLVETWNSQGFLAWDPTARSHDPPAADDRAEFVTHFTNLVSGSGETGCPYSAPLEAWYRFLIDPEPPLEVVRALDPETGQEVSTPVGLDEILLAERAMFLRPDSMLVIVMVTDDDDCSIVHHGAGWQVGNGQPGTMPRSNSICDTNPNDRCCLSCIQTSWPEGCTDPASDPKCQQQPWHSAEDDPLGLRCYDQKRRFGVDLLQPASRYVRALTEHQIPRRDGTLAENPLFGSSDTYPHSPVRLDSSLIFLAGIVGVPWQDIATDDTLLDPVALRYQTAAQLNQNGIWDEILGEPTASPPLPPSDPFLRQSVAPRRGINPRTGIAIEPPSDERGGNAINGHEQLAVENSALQYSCIAPLNTVKHCADADYARYCRTGAEPDCHCACAPENPTASSPLCDGSEQLYYGARPPPRILQVLKDYGANSIVSSICAKNVRGSGTAPSYGFNPTLQMIVNGPLRSERRRCIPRQLPLDPATGQLHCWVVEVTRAVTGPECNSPGRAPLEAEFAAAVEDWMRTHEMCGSSGNPCDDYSSCEIRQLTAGPELEACLNDPDAEGEAAGYCFIDAMAAVDRNDDGELSCELSVDDPSTPARREDCIGNPHLVADCPSDERRDLRFMGTDDNPIPWPQSHVLVACPTELLPPD